MNGPPDKEESPAATGLSSNENTKTQSVGATGDHCNVIEQQTIAAMRLRGFAVHAADEGFLVCRWNLSRHCPDLRALVAFARQAGATC